MATIEAMRAERATTLAKAQAVVAKATSQGRETLTAAEQVEVSEATDRINLLDRQIKGRQLTSSVLGLTNADHNPDQQHFGVFSEQDRDGIIHAAKSMTTFRGDLNMKAAIGSATLVPTSGRYTEGGLHPNSQFPFASLWPQEAAEGPTIRYYRTTSGVAAVVAEAGLKPDSGVSFTGIDLALTKLACTAQYTTEMAEDGPWLVQHLGDELVAAVLAAENKLVIDTFTATSGVLTATGALTAVVDLVADAVASQEAVSGLTPTAVLAHPSVIAAIRKSKASTSGVYNVDILSDQPSMLHGLRLVSSPAVPAANAWVVCSTGVVMYRRGPVKFEVGTNGTDLVYNTRTAVAEERCAVAVTRPNSLFKLVLT